MQLFYDPSTVFKMLQDDWIQISRDGNEYCTISNSSQAVNTPENTSLEDSLPEDTPLPDSTPADTPHVDAPPADALPLNALPMVTPPESNCEYCMSSITASFTPRMSVDYQLLKIKVRASGITQKLQIIEQIKNGLDWDSEDESEHQYALCCMKIEQRVEDATRTSEEIVIMTEQLLSSPPAYNDNPEEQRHRQVEILVLSELLLEYITGLERQVMALKQQVFDAFGTRVQELYLRAKQIHTETHFIIDGANKIRSEESTR